MSKNYDGGWIGVDLDGTLAFHDKFSSLEHIGSPIPDMQNRVLKWLEDGVDVRIFTARASRVLQDPSLAEEVCRPIIDWCVKHLGRPLPITCFKDFKMVELWDDRCVSVESNTGRIIGSHDSEAPASFTEVDGSQVGVTLRIDDGLVYMDTSSPVRWIAMRPDQALDFARGITEMSQSIIQQTS